MKGDTQFTRTKHLNDPFLEMRHFHSQFSSNLNESIVEKQLYAGKVPSFPTFVTIKGNILSFLYLKSTVRIRPSAFRAWDELTDSYLFKLFLGSSVSSFSV